MKVIKKLRAFQNPKIIYKNNIQSDDLINQNNVIKRILILVIEDHLNLMATHPPHSIAQLLKSLPLKTYKKEIFL